MASSQPFTADIHTHILPADLPDIGVRHGLEGFIRLEHSGPGCARMMQGSRVFRELKANSWDPEVRIAECDRAGVDLQVLSTIPVLFSYGAPALAALDLARHLNDHLASVVARYPDRFVGLGTVPLQEPDLAIAEMERCIRDLGLVGIEIGSHVNGWNLSAPELFPFFAAAERLSAALFVHPWDMMGRERMPDYWLPWLVGMPAEASLAICSLIFGGVLERLPRLRVAVAHGGGAFPFTFGRIERGWAVRPDLVAVDNPRSPRDYLDRLYFDTLVHDSRALEYLIAFAGVEHLALGSDYPFPLGESEPGALIRSLESLPDADKARLLGGTAREWLNIDSDATDHRRSLTS
ncbi:MAG: amidohydrolase [Calditrichaeota bacterium]|nr:amidohydrolase [Calditrichota bacterium]